MKISRLLVLGTLLVALCMATPARAAVSSLIMTFGVEEDFTYSDGTVHYYIVLTNLSLPGAVSATVDVTFSPPGPTGVLGAYGTPILIDDQVDVPVGAVISYNWDGSGGATAVPVLAYDLGSIPLNPGVIVAYASAGFDGAYNDDPPYDAVDSRNIPVQVINPDTLVGITATPNSGMFPITTDLVVTEQNTGTGPLTAVQVAVSLTDSGGTDPVALLSYPPDSFSGGDADNVLESGETWTWNTGALVDIVLNEDTTFTALGTGLDSLLNEVSFATGYLGEKAEALVNGEYPPPCIDVTKTVNCDEATVGATVTYHYCITNCSTLEMHITNIADNVVTDAVVAAAFMAAHTNDDTLNPAEQVCFDVPYVIKVTDADPLINTVRVDAEDTSFRQAIYDEATATVDILIPCLLLEKSCTSLDPVQKGGVAFFRVTLTNCGDLDLMVDVTDADDTDCDALLDGQLAVGASTFCDLEVDIPLDFSGTEFINHVTADWATIPALPCVTLIEDTENDEAPCEVTGGATRTPGFWKTHTTFAEHVLLTHCGGVLDLGFVELDTIDEICAYFWANKANNTDGSKRDKLCQARMHAAFHAIAALLNNCVPSGGGIPVSPAEIATILGGTDIDAIKALASELAAYNESGDDVALIDPDASPGSATPQECKAYDQSIADCLAVTTTKGKGPK